MTRPDIICIGSVLWDVIGRTDLPMVAGNDKPGRIIEIPGGVAMNIAMTLVKFGQRPALLSVLGRDAAGDRLAAEGARMGLDMAHICRAEDLPTDRYMAIEGPAGLIAAIADAHSLERAGETILAPLRDGRLGSAAQPWDGPIALDGNLTEPVLAALAADPALGRADLRVAPASPGKALRLLALRAHPRASYYVNREEAGLLLGRLFEDAAEAAAALHAAGLARAIVTDGARAAADASGAEVIKGQPPAVPQRRVTGAGDTFMAAHIAAEIAGLGREAALARALDCAARYVSGEDDV